jgi:alpha-ketoglutarate-dependent taurine dioxygenase
MRGSPSSSPTVSPPPPLAACWSRKQLIDRSQRWFRVLPRALKPRLIDLGRAFSQAGHSLETLRPLDEPCPGLRAFGEELRDELCEGSGVAFVTGLAPPDGNVPDAWLRWAYLLLGMQIGAPMRVPTRLLDLAGPRCYRGPGAEEKGAGPETTFHTDSAAPDCVPDAIGMLCLRPALSGGECQVTSAARAREAMWSDCRDLVAELHAPFIREPAAAGPRLAREKLLATRQPVFAPAQRRPGLRLDYMRRRIEAGHLHAGVPLTARQIEAFDRLDGALNDPAACVKLQLRRGDMLFINNHLVAHNRRDYVDAVEPGRQRLMVRLWLSLDPGRF